MIDLVPDLLAPDLRLVVCGTALGPESARRRQYYAGPGNRFWQILHQTGLTPYLLGPARYRELLELGIGLTDVVKDQSGVDRTIDFSAHGHDRLLQKIRMYRPAVLGFNGKRSAMVALDRAAVGYGLQSERIERTLVFVAPSTSAAARRWWDAHQWHRLARIVRGEGG